MPLSSTIGIAGHEDDKMKLEDTGEDLKDMTVAANSETRSSQPTKALNVETQHKQGELVSTILIVKLRRLVVLIIKKTEQLTEKVAGLQKQVSKQAKENGKMILTKMKDHLSIQNYTSCKTA